MYERMCAREHTNGRVLVGGRLEQELNMQRCVRAHVNHVIAVVEAPFC